MPRLPKPPEALKPWLPMVVGAVVVALLAGVVIGRLLPGSAVSDRPGPSSSASAGPGGHSHGGESGSEPDGANLTGLSLSASGYTLVPADTTLTTSDKPRTWRFTITNTAGDPATEFVTVHDEKMHLFAMRRDFTGYQHVHPVMDDEGTWSVDLTFARPGIWRVITDFAVGGGKDVTNATLGTDVTVPGDYQPEAIPEPAATVTADGFAVSLDFDPELGASAPALVAVRRDGENVKLDRYLGAYGHLVLMRRDDMGFAHVHPDTERVGAKLRFWATIPAKGDYRAFLDFKVDGEVHTAAFTIRV